MEDLNLLFSSLYLCSQLHEVLHSLQATNCLGGPEVKHSVTLSVVEHLILSHCHADEGQR